MVQDSHGNFAGAGASDVRTWQNFTYDHGNRLTDQQYSYALHGASLTAPTFTLANMVYNAKWLMAKVRSSGMLKAFMSKNMFCATI
jgi:hypothetical protein